MADAPAATATAPIPPTATATTPQAPISTDPTPAAPPTPAAFDWSKAGLDETSLNLVNTKGWKSPADSVSSYANLEKVIGVPPERIVRLPDPKAADAKAWDAVYDQLGRPPTPDKYVLPLPEGDKGEFANLVKPILHKAGLSQSQATVVGQEWNALAAAQKQASEAKHAQMVITETSELKQIWGPEYDTRAGLVDKAAEEFKLSDKLFNAMKEASPKEAMEYLYNVGKRLGVEDSQVPGMGGQDKSFGRMTPEMAHAKIEEYKKPGSGFAQLMNSKDPKQRMDALAEMNALQQLAHPGMTPVGGSR
jgi:hypothetical protein